MNKFYHHARRTARARSDAAEITVARGTSEALETILSTLVDEVPTVAEIVAEIDTALVTPEAPVADVDPDLVEDPVAGFVVDAAPVAVADVDPDLVVELTEALAEVAVLVPVVDEEAVVAAAAVLAVVATVAVLAVVAEAVVAVVGFATGIILMSSKNTTGEFPLTLFWN